MRHLFLTFIASMLIFGSVEAQLNNAATNENIAKVKSANEKVSSIACKFQQTKKMSFIDNSVITEGDFYFNKPNKLSMLYSNGEVMIVNGQDVTIGKKGKVRNIKAKNKQVEGLVETLLACMNGDIASLDGTLKNVEKKAGEITFNIDVDLVVGKGAVSSLVLKYCANDLTIKSINMVEPDGSYTLYELNKKSLNTEISPSVYVQKKKQ